MTKQETFDIVVNHLRGMTEQSRAPVLGSTCAYRGANGAKCAVGCLIPDAVYHKRLEGYAANSYWVAPVLESLGHDVLLCEDLQMVHDNAFGAKEAGLREVAKKHGLVYTAPDIEGVLHAHGWEGDK